MRVVTFKIEEELLSDLDYYCLIRNTIRSVVIRRAIKWYLDRERNIIVTNHLRIYPNIHIDPQHRRKHKRKKRLYQRSIAKPMLDYEVT